MPIVHCVGQLLQYIYLVFVCSLCVNSPIVFLSTLNSVLYLWYSRVLNHPLIIHLRGGESSCNWYTCTIKYKTCVYYIHCHLFCTSNLLVSQFLVESNHITIPFETLPFVLRGWFSSSRGKVNCFFLSI